MAINILRRKIQTPVNTNIKGTGTEKYGDVSGLSREERLELIYQKRPDLRPKTGVFEIPITKEVKERVLAKPFTPTEQSIFTGTIPELVVQGFRKELEKGRIYDWFIKTQPERYKKLSIQPEIFTQQGRNKLVSKGLITSEESEIFSAIPEYTPVITGMKEVGVKDFIKIMGDAMTYAGRTSKYVDIELYYGDDETIYNLVDIYFDDKNLYLIIGDEK